MKLYRQDLKVVCCSILSLFFLVFPAPNLKADCPCGGSIVVGSGSPSIETFETRNECDLDGSSCYAPATGCVINGGAVASNWRNATGDDMDWIVNSGGTPTDNTGPNAGNTGKYIYTESSCADIGYPNRDALLESTKCFNFQNIVAPELSFDYHMYGLEMGDITVEARTTSDCNDWTVIDTISGQQQTSGTGWKNHITNLFAYAGTSNLRLRIRGKTGIYIRSDMALDNIQVREAPANDLSLKAITSPVNKCGMGSDETVKIQVENLGYNPQTGFPVSYRVDGGTLVTETFNLPSGVPPGSTVEYTFATKADLSVVGSHIVEAFVNLGSDSNPANNQASLDIESVPTISTFPYTQSFESGSGGWIAEGTNSTWVLGKPAKTIINSAGGGLNSWVTGGLDVSKYRNNENSDVIGPCFNFSNLKVPVISMKAWWNAEGGADTGIDGYDGAVLQSSINSGTSWQTVGSKSGLGNWYTGEHLVANPGNQNSSSQLGKIFGWTGGLTTGGGSGGWVTASQLLKGPTGTSLGQQSNVRLRVAFASDSQVGDDGFAFDDIVIQEGMTATKSASFVLDANSNGRADPGDKIKYTVVISNNTSSTVTGVVFDDTPDVNSSLIVGSVVPTPNRTVTLGNTAGNTMVKVTVGSMNPNSTQTIVFQVNVNNPGPSSSFQICNQGSVVGTVSGLNLNLLTDDTSVGGGSDKTCVLAYVDSDNDGVIDQLDQCPGFPDSQDADHDGKPDACDLCPADPAKIAPLVCGCGTPDTDSDSDGVPNCNDQCPSDPNKMVSGNGSGQAPGICGCGTADTDSDSDGTANCIETCDNDPNKLSPGVCGCGNPDTDSDSDGVPNCNDQCPSDPNKKVSGNGSGQAPGICGCGTADTDTDGDGVANCNDACPADPNKNVSGNSSGQAPGLCGCGVADTDSDSDGTPNCQDLCPFSVIKTAPGACGCNTADTDSDSDGVPDCNDQCPSDPNKKVSGSGAGQAPGQCGCGVADTDSDGDGTPNCNDQCPADPNKKVSGNGVGQAPGVCGCGVADIDTDNDGTLDCSGDQCPADPLKTNPGQCGCGVADTDTDSDGVADCIETCDNDPLKTSEGVCGCGTPDSDSDGDGTLNCNDQCPSDPNKKVSGSGSGQAPGICGCGIADTDSDGDGTANCIETCDNDPNKVAPGACGCGTPDTDSDGDGVANCNDACPADPNKKVAGTGSGQGPGLCGCGTADTDSDGDGAPNCNDQCPNDPGKKIAGTGSGQAPGLCGCGTADTDSDSDGVPNCSDQCPNDPAKKVPGTNAGQAPGQCGCGIADTDSDSDGIPNCTDLCPNGGNNDSDGDGVMNCLESCPNDPLKIAPGVCGCGVADVNSDGDSKLNCEETCDDDPLKLSPGTCGCGTADTDSDGDGVPNCNDQCAGDSNKTNPGVCGCGASETDTDGDGTPNCIDLCPVDPGKTLAGVCGCGTPDADSDNDGTLNCLDLCPSDSTKTSGGVCGCGVPDADTDGDGKINCVDACPADPIKFAPGICGCGKSDADNDGDGVSDCVDICPSDSSKIGAGVCGCGVPDSDNDKDGTLDCLDECPANSRKASPGICGCGVADTDSDRDGRVDCQDACPLDGAKVSAGSCGCGVPDQDLNTNGILDCQVQSDLKAQLNSLAGQIKKLKIYKGKKGPQVDLRNAIKAKTDFLSKYGSANAANVLFKAGVKRPLPSYITFVAKSNAKVIKAKNTAAIKAAAKQAKQAITQLLKVLS